MVEKIKKSSMRNNYGTIQCKKAGKYYIVMIFLVLLLLLASCMVSTASVNEVTKLTASDAAEDDYFGYSVSVDGHTMVIGTLPFYFNSGSVYVYTHSGGTWTEQQKLTASDAAIFDGFGNSVSIEGDTIVIGAYGDDGSSGSAYVFTHSGGTWTEQQKLTASDAAGGDVFGYAVSVDGDSIVIGARLDDDDAGNSGSAYVFTRSGTTWTEQQKLTASDAAGGDGFGNAVSVDGDSIVIGAYYDDDDAGNSGSAYVFTRSGTTWTEQQKLTASDAAKYDGFGHAISVDRNTILIGADGYSDHYSGSAYVFTRSGTTWTEQQKLTASDPAEYDHFGCSISFDGNTILIGVKGDDGSSGSAYVFTHSGGVSRRSTTNSR